MKVLDTPDSRGIYSGTTKKETPVASESKKSGVGRLVEKLLA
jgi:hypothetical protein